ncbi:uncharacterized protein TRAVEDRAFT_23930 [Trametes versicolor FP-101664 SS1]|uniref:uncharacterized protein n=1 Tax=Trametes versicolor (strain FP-101664) TaxID=717944 RepID=UPI0004622145|nr:uncharacterized protein TRAVEDRAFT_23930 [Trametes versicolor FP-101664 SS1]EIW53667.1 hypothetical protein TRAVEDRAFT_23930 [Trametes versicolor FP-101664 SS1]
MNPPPASPLDSDDAVARTQRHEELKRKGYLDPKGTGRPEDWMYSLNPSKPRRRSPPLRPRVDPVGLKLSFAQPRPILARLARVPLPRDTDPDWQLSALIDEEPGLSLVPGAPLREFIAQRVHLASYDISHYIQGFVYVQKAYFATEAHPPPFPARPQPLKESMTQGGLLEKLAIQQLKSWRDSVSLDLRRIVGNHAPSGVQVRAPQVYIVCIRRRRLPNDGPPVWCYFPQLEGRAVHPAPNLATLPTPRREPTLQILTSQVQYQGSPYTPYPDPHDRTHVAGYSGEVNWQGPQYAPYPTSVVQHSPPTPRRTSHHSLTIVVPGHGSDPYRTAQKHNRTPAAMRSKHKFANQRGAETPVATKSPVEAGLTVAHLLTLLVRRQYDGWLKTVGKMTSAAKVEDVVGRGEGALPGVEVEYGDLYVVAIRRSTGRDGRYRWFPQIECNIRRDGESSPGDDGISSYTKSSAASDHKDRDSWGSASPEKQEVP